MQRRSILTFVDRDIRLRRPTEEDLLKNYQVSERCFVLVDAKTDEILAMMYHDQLFDRDGNHFEDAP